MRRILTLAVAALIFASASVAAQAPPAPTLQAMYQGKYAKVKHRFGARAPGRNILKYGVVTSRHRIRGATWHEVAVSIRVLRTMLHPPVPPAPRSSSGTGVQVPSYGGGLPACTWEHESGGDYGALNPSSGAGGKYQIIPSTWAAYGGTGSPHTASPAEQEAVARKLYAAEGARPWVNC